LIPASDVAAGAADVVSDVARAFSAADFRTINLETVVGVVSEADAYPKKSIVYASRPETLAGVGALGVDLAILANNHACDYLDDGVAGTLRALDAAGIAHVGATANATPSPAFIANVHGTRIGVLAYSAVSGSSTNDGYARDGEPVPADIATSDAWQYDPRLWGFMDPAWNVTEATRRIGSAWTLFAEQESSQTLQEGAKAWSSLWGVYPELQDWVARRGHGGAAYFDASTAPAEIAALRPRVDLLIVQVHGGVQYAPTSTTGIQKTARLAIDAGADIVICHHPHVLQPVEYYKGKPIFYSLGNFVFDQDLFATFQSAFLRTVWEGNELVQARLVPVVIDSYRPVPLVGRAAARTLFNVWEASATHSTNGNVEADIVGNVVTTADADTQSASFVLEHNTGRITSKAPIPTTKQVVVFAGKTVSLDIAGLVDPRLGLAMGAGPEIWVGRDLFGWGSFEDETVDDRWHGDTHWELETCQKNAILGDAAHGRGFLRVRSKASSSGPTFARLVARVPLPAHRYYSPAAAIDANANYSLQLFARQSAAATAYVRVDLYRVSDAFGAEQSTADALASLRLPLHAAVGTTWHEVEIALPQDQLAQLMPAPNTALVYLELKQPDQGEVDLDVDDFALVEWRQANAMPHYFGNWTLAKNTGTADTTLDVPLWPAQ
jgi:poly-gamma-glutamate capsule biosynthesis protein CapA/YwtB (metallophosphatase superfamily)